MRHHFMFLYRCGCPLGLTDKGRWCPDEDKAWERMFETRREERKARNEGITVKLVDHDTYCRDYYHRMTAKCPHQGGA